MACLLRSIRCSPVDQRAELRRGYDAAQDFQGNRGEGDTNQEFRNAYTTWMPAHHSVICGAYQYAAPSNGVAIHGSHDRLGVEKDRFEHRDQSREKSLEICRTFVQEPEEVNASGKYMSSSAEDDGACARALEGCQLCGQRLTELYIEGVRLAVADGGDRDAVVAFGVLHQHVAHERSFFRAGTLRLVADGGLLVFSDIPSDELKKWSKKDGLSTFRKPRHNTHGNTRDGAGRRKGAMDVSEFLRDPDLCRRIIDGVHDPTPANNPPRGGAPTLTEKGAQGLSAFLSQGKPDKPAA